MLVGVSTLMSGKRGTMRAYIRELDKPVYHKVFKDIPAGAYDTATAGVPEDIDIIVRNVIAIEETSDRMTRVSFGKNKIHPFTIELHPSDYYQIEII